MMENNKGILLEAGTNELEIVEFGMAHNRFGINVMKVREIINPLPVTKIPQSHPHVEGIIELRGEVLPVVDVAKVIGFAPSDTPEKDKFIVTEFNQQKIVFHVHSVSQIHRISWEQIEKPSEMYQTDDSHIIGVIKLHGDMILLLDFEKMVVDINPEAGIHVQRIKNIDKRDRTNQRLIIAEDSPLLRKLLQDTLTEAGFQHLVFFENGKEAFEYLQGLIDAGKDVEKEVQLVITDIEMPQMDGHHLTKKIKDHSKLAHLPVIIFSSLITEDLRHKGEKVGANAQVSKPEIGELVSIIDQFLFV